jgi:hypothetical protein
MRAGRNMTGHLRPDDNHLIEKWRQDLLERRWSRSSADRAAARLRAFARLTRHGLLHAGDPDVGAYARSRCGPTESGLTTFLRSEGWRQWVRTIRNFYRWLGERELVGFSGDPTVGVPMPPPGPGRRITVRQERLYEQLKG